MLRVGLSGGIGSGKSTASRRLVERGAVLIDSDVLAREVVAVGTEGLAQVRERFGDTVIATDGALDRAALGRLVFADAAARDELNAIIHPRVQQATRDRMAAAPDDAVVVHDIPLLVELDRGAEYHLTVIVGADEATRLSRLVHDRGMPESDARARIAAQATDESRTAAADVWLANEGSVEDLRTTVDALWDGRLHPYAENLRTRTPAGDAEAGADALAAARVGARVRRQVEAAGLADRVRTQEPTYGAGVVAVSLAVDDADAIRSPDLELAVLAAGFVPAASPSQHPGAPAGGEPADPLAHFASADPGQAAYLEVWRV